MQSQRPDHNDALNYYKILGLPPPRQANAKELSDEELKSAYHRTLLLNHPDKIRKINVEQPVIPNARASDRIYSIDEIVSAYKTLSEPKLKIEYDQALFLRNSNDTRFQERGLSNGLHAGVEAFDLDDLNFDESNGRWSKKCRCGDTGGFVVTESELEEFSKDGEIYVGCAGCSLLIKVLFGIVESASP